MAKTGRNTAASVSLVLAAALALLGVVLHHGVLAEYGIITDTAFEGLVWGLTAGLSGAALMLVLVLAVFAVVCATRTWMQVTAAAIPVIMLIAMLALTPVALRQKIDAQYDAVPQCMTEGAVEPAAGAERESQRAFDSIPHLGDFSRGGASGVGGCDRSLEVPEEVDVLAHYREVLPEAGWEVTDDDAGHLRARREGTAFEVTLCSGGGVVWAGSEDDAGPQCQDP